jgi:nucleotide-binding universal stress UspA family protein
VANIVDTFVVNKDGMKILLATNGVTLNLAAVNFACYLANLSGSTLTGVFLENLIFEPAYLSNDKHNAGFNTIIESSNLPENDDRKKACSDSIIQFKDACVVRETPCKVHRDRGLPYNHLMMETRFADLLVVDAGLNFDNEDGESSGDLIERILAHAECPVIVAPGAHIAVDELCFTYNGSASSVYAIKQFAYLFPQLRDMKVTVLEIRDAAGQVTEQFRVNEWLKDHFSNVNYHVVESDDEGSALLKMTLVKQNCLFVLGAFGRSGISNFFKGSRANRLVRITNEPLFITHRTRH